MRIHAGIDRLFVAAPDREPDCRTWRVEMQRIVLAVIRQLVQYTQVIEYPETPPLCCGDEIPILHLQVRNRHDRQVQLQRFPSAAVIQGVISAPLGSGVQQTAPLRIRAQHAREVGRRDAVGNAAHRVRSDAVQCC